MELYIVALVDDNGNVEGFPKGGGSSSPSFIRAFESKSSAKRSASRLNFAPANVKVIRVTDYEEVE
ncbi:hypothetical protein AB990_08955 [Alkalihalobacillus pseudalcaliphilus]|nr:hypothetical protein AB990_08955 [Alkalihalobacillus pseudalcaliphilus]